MRIAYVCADPGIAVFDWKKGCSIHVQEIVRAFGRMGHEVELFAMNTAGIPPADLKSVRVHRLPMPPRSLDRARREEYLLRANHALSSALAAAGSFDLVYERYSLWSFSALEYAAAESVPSVLEVNSPLIDEQSRYRSLVDRDAALAVARQCFTRATIVCAVSDEVRDSVTAVSGRTRDVHVIPNGVDPDRFAPVATLPQPYGMPFTVGFVGSLKPWHGVSELVEAFATVRRVYPPSRLLVVGDGPERDAIEAQISARRLTDCTELTGAVRPAEIPRLLERMDVGVAPYPRLKNFYFSPMKVYEYMAASLPVVASETGQLRRVIHDEVEGLLYPCGDVDALVESLLCLQRDPAMRRRLGAAGRRKVLAQFTWRRVVSRIVRASGAASREVGHDIGNRGYDALSTAY